MKEKYKNLDKNNRDAAKGFCLIGIIVFLILTFSFNPIMLIGIVISIVILVVLNKWDKEIVVKRPKPISKKPLKIDGYSKEQLLEWQNLIMKDKLDKLIMSENQLKNESQNQAQRDLEIINDCTRILQDTVKPDTFFMRLELLENTSKHLSQLADYISFTGSNPKDAYKEVLDQKQDCITNFIVRCFNYTFDKAETMKTIKGKNNQYERFYNSLLPYMDLMNDYNKNYIERKYKDHIQ